MKHKLKIGDIVFNKFAYMGQMIIIKVEEKFCKAMFITGKYDGRVFIIRKFDDYAICGNIFEENNKNED